MAKNLSLVMGPALVLLLVIAVVGASWRLKRNQASWTQQRQIEPTPAVVDRPSTLSLFWQGRRPGHENPPAQQPILRAIRDLRNRATLLGVNINDQLPDATTLARLSDCRSPHDEPCASTVRHLQMLEVQLNRRPRGQP